MEMDADGELAMKTARIAELEGMPKLVKEMTEALGAAKNTLTRCELELIERAAEVRRRTDDAAAIRDRARKLEADIAKIRTAIGEKTMKEILAEEEKKL